MDLTQHDLSTLDFEAVHALISDIYEQLLILKVCVITNIPVTYFPPALLSSSPRSFCCRLLCRMVCVVFFFFFWQIPTLMWFGAQSLIEWGSGNYKAFRIPMGSGGFFFFFKHLCIWEIWLKGNNSYFDKYQFCLALHNEFSFVCSALCVDFCCRIFWENSYLFSLCWCVFGFNL